MFSLSTGQIKFTLSDMWDADTLHKHTHEWSEQLSSHTIENTKRNPIGILADNGPDWIAIDLAAIQNHAILIPLPTFFSQGQLHHVIHTAQINLLITDQPERAETLGFYRMSKANTRTLHIMQRPLSPPLSLPKDIAKITFTSGTTGQPKGVCLGFEQQLHLAQALQVTTEPLHIQTHLCLLPFAVLLENIAGVYTALLSNATIVCPPLNNVGLTGASQFDAQRCLDAIALHQAESIIVLPHMLYALLQACGVNDSRTRSLKFIAVGGGKVARHLLQQAHAANLPVFEGYGLSECASVVCLNTPENQRIGTVGKPLPHVTIRVDEHHEIWVKSARRSVYLDEALSNTEPVTENPAWIATGDLGTLSPDGFLSIQGRKKNQIITSFGRNICPEWPEDLLMSSGHFLQAAIFGEAQPHLTAVLVPTLPIQHTEVQQIISTLNQQLPDYAQIHQFVMANEPFHLDNGLSTANGRLKREAIFKRYLSDTTQQGETQ